MTTSKDIEWIDLLPPLGSDALDEFRRYARVLLRLRGSVPECEALVGAERTAFTKGIAASERSDRQPLLAAGLVLTDLVLQGWQLRIRRGHVQVRQPLPLSEDRGEEKERIRRQ